MCDVNHLVTFITLSICTSVFSWMNLILCYRFYFIVTVLNILFSIFFLCLVLLSWCFCIVSLHIQYQLITRRWWNRAAAQNLNLVGTEYFCAANSTPNVITSFLTKKRETCGIQRLKVPLETGPQFIVSLALSKCLVSVGANYLNVIYLW